MPTTHNRPTRTATGYRLGELVADLGKGLAPRELHVMLCKSNGLTGKESAEILECSVNNITQIMQRVLYKLHAKRSTDAISHAFQRGIVHYSVILIAVFMGIMPPHENAPACVKTRAPITIKIKTRSNRRPDELESLES